MAVPESSLFRPLHAESLRKAYIGQDDYSISVARGIPTFPAELTMRLEPDEDDAEWFVVTVEGVPGIVSQGRGLTEAIANGFEAISAFLGSLAKDGITVPAKLTVRTKVLRAA